MQLIVIFGISKKVLWGRNDINVVFFYKKNIYNGGNEDVSFPVTATDCDVLRV